MVGTINTAAIVNVALAVCPVPASTALASVRVNEIFAAAVAAILTTTVVNIVFAV